MTHAQNTELENWEHAQNFEMTKQEICIHSRLRNSNDVQNKKNDEFVQITILITQVACCFILNNNGTIPHMYLKSIVLQNFRNYKQSKFEFNSDTTIIVGENTAGKTNLTEGILLIATGKSFKAQKDYEMIRFGQDVSHIGGLVVDDRENKTKLEVTIAQGESAGGRFIKRYSVNGVAKSRNNFVGFLPTVLFRPEELDIIIDGPSLRRQFLDNVLETVDRDYRFSKTTYDKALRQRNALLDLAKETGKRNTEQFAYWDNLLITNGQIITKKRGDFLNFVNSSGKNIFDIETIYDKSVISRERLDEYIEAEVGAGNTLVGPQRDDFFILGLMDYAKEKKDLRNFGSRGQQRLAILQLKLLQINFTEKILNQEPLFVLDDIFSELDSSHIALVLDRVKGMQIIITTTHKEFIEKNQLQDFSVIELKR